jgi:hypothetical protein
MGDTEPDVYHVLDYIAQYADGWSSAMASRAYFNALKTNSSTRRS